MGKLAVTEFVSVDGVLEDPGGVEGYEHGGSTLEYDRGEDGDRFKLGELSEAQLQLLGLVTHEGFAAARPSGEGPFAERLNSDPKYVVSTTLTDPEWGTRQRSQTTSSTGSRSSKTRPTASSSLRHCA